MAKYDPFTAMSSIEHRTDDELRKMAAMTRRGLSGSAFIKRELPEKKKNMELHNPQYQG